MNEFGHPALQRVGWINNQLRGIDEIQTGKCRQSLIAVSAGSLNQASTAIVESVLGRGRRISHAAAVSQYANHLLVGLMLRGAAVSLCLSRSEVGGPLS